MDCKLPEIVFPETCCAAAQSSTSALVYQLGHIRAVSTVQVPMCDRIEVTELMYDTMFRLMCHVSVGPYSGCKHGAGSDAHQ